MIGLKSDTYLVLVVCLKFLSLFTSATGKSTFLVIAPRSIRSNSIYSLSVTTVDVAQPVRVRVRILEREEQPHNKTIIYYTPNLNNTTPDPLDMIAMFGPQGDVAMTTRTVDVWSSDMRLETPLTFLRRKSVVVEPGVATMVNFKIGRDLKPGSYQLEIQTLERNVANFSARHFLFLESKTFSIFIQTEKAMYRRNELVRYRVLVLDADTRPIKVEQNLTMSIYDAGQTLVLLKANQSAMHGVYRGSFRIGLEDKPGMWTIEADFKGKQIRKSIEVADFVAPRFQVALSVPMKISPNTSEFLVAVDAKYTFGRPVRGTVTISLTPVFLSPDGWPELGEALIGTDVINGRYLFPFEMKQFGDKESNVFDAIMVQATVEERTTGVLIRSHDKTVRIDQSKQATKYKITLSSFRFYLPGAEYLLSVQVKTSNGQPLSDDNQTVEVRVAYDSESFENSTTISVQLDGKGRGDRLIEVPATTKEGMTIRCAYLDASTEVRLASKQLHVEIITETPVLNKKVEFRVGSVAPLSSLSYYVVGRGSLLVSKSVPVADKQFEMFEFKATFAMTPVSALVVFYVDKNGEIVSDYTEIEFSKDSLQNSISVTASKDSLEPQQDLKLTVQTEDGSYIGLSCIDQSSMLVKRGHDLSLTRIFNDLQLYDNQGDFDINVAFKPAFVNMLKPGSIVLTDALKYKDGANRSLSGVYVRSQLMLDYRPDVFSNILIPVSPTCKASSLDETTQNRYLNNETVRSQFPDSILWEDVVDVDFETVIHTKVPDTITSWYISGFTLHPEHGLGLMEAPLVVTTFKPFFVDVDLPSSATVGESLTVIVSIHNYFEQSVMAEVEVSGDFAVEALIRHLDAVDADETELRNLGTSRVKVRAEGEGSLAFTIKPLQAGNLQLKVSATSSLACDTLIKKLYVKPEGLTLHEKKVHTLLLSGETVADVLNVEIPEIAVSGSVKSRLAVQGDKYTLDLENFHNDLAPPSGSGVTYLREFVSYTINAKQFLVANSDIAGIIESVELNSQEALDYLLESQCEDGGFSATENCTDPNRDTWYTATNVEVLGELSVFLTMDFDIMHKSLDYLVSIQSEDGSFAELSAEPVSKIYTSGPRLTAYVLNTFISVVLLLPDPHRYDGAIKAASRFLITQVFDVDLLTLSLFHNSLKLMNDVNAEVAQELISLKAFKNERSIRWFEASDPQTEIELLQLNLQGALLVGERPVNAMRIASGLTQMLVENFNVSQKSEQANAIRTLSLYSEVFATQNTNVSLSFFIDESDIRAEVEVKKRNRFLMNRFDILPSVRKIGYSASGTGFVNVELNYQFNMPAELFVKAFGLATEVLPIENRGWVLNVCTNFVDPTGEMKSNTAIMRVQFPVGITTSQFVEDNDEFSQNILGKELIDGGLVVQFKGLNLQSSCFAVPLQRTAFARQKLIGNLEIFEVGQPLYRNSMEFTMPSYDSKTQYENTPGKYD